MQFLSQTQHVFNTKINWWWQKLSTKPVCETETMVLSCPRTVLTAPLLCSFKFLNQALSFHSTSQTESLKERTWKQVQFFGVEKMLAPGAKWDTVATLLVVISKVLAKGWFWAINELKFFRDHDWRFQKFWKWFPENCNFQLKCQKKMQLLTHFPQIWFLRISTLKS